MFAGMPWCRTLFTAIIVVIVDISISIIDIIVVIIVMIFIRVHVYGMRVCACAGRPCNQKGNESLRPFAVRLLRRAPSSGIHSNRWKRRMSVYYARAQLVGAIDFGSENLAGNLRFVRQATSTNSTVRRPAGEPDSRTSPGANKHQPVNDDSKSYEGEATERQRR